MNRFVFLFALIFAVGIPAYSQETFTAHTLKGLDGEGRLNPVWTSIEDGYATGRYLIPDASGNVTCKPIDVRGMDYINFQLTAGNPADTTATPAVSLSVFGSVLGSANSSIGGATFMFDSDISTLPISLVPTDATATAQSSPKIKRVDVRGLAWVLPYIARTATTDATNVLYYGGQKRREY